jgi:hypothetical protein
MAKVLIDKKNNRILVVADAKGFFSIHDYGLVKNKFTRNFGYIIDGLLRRANVSVYDMGGTSRTAYVSYGGLARSGEAGYDIGVPFYIIFGYGTTAPTITDNNLVSLTDWLNVSIYDIVELSNETSIVLAGRWASTVSKTLSEVGLLYEFFLSSHYKTLLARTVVTGGISKTALTTYLDGYKLTFPATFSRWFIRALFACMIGLYCVQWMCLPVRDTTGAWFVVRNADTFAGSPDARIGRDNTPASPDHYNLLDPIGSLSSQSQTVEVDTVNQEVRVVRTGTYTPSTTETLGEIGLFATLNVYSDTTVVTKTFLIARVPLDTKVTLYPSTTYTLGIVLRFA